MNWDTNVMFWFGFFLFLFCGLFFFLSCVIQIIEHSLALSAFNLVLYLMKQISPEMVLVFRHNTALTVLELSSFWMPDPFLLHFKNHTHDS